MKASAENQKLMLISLREHERVPFTKRLTVMDSISGRKYEGNGIDISVKGIGFYSEKFLAEETRISIQVWLDETKKDPVWINATVKWAKLEQDGAIIGAQFNNLVKSAEHPRLYEMICKVMKVVTIGSTMIV